MSPDARVAFPISQRDALDAFVDDGGRPGFVLTEREAQQLASSNVAEANGKPIDFTGPDGQSHHLQPVEVTLTSPGGVPGVSREMPLVNWVGQEYGEKGDILASGAFTISPDGKIFGRVSTGTQQLIVEPDRSTGHMLRTANPAEHGDEGSLGVPVGEVADAQAPTPSSGPEAASSDADRPVGNRPAVQTPGTQATDGPYIDLMVVYTAGLPPLFPLQAASEVNNINAALINSSLAQRVRLTTLAQVSYVSQGDLSTDLRLLQNPGDSYLDEVHGWRDSTRSDLVALVVPSTSTNACGLGYLQLASGSPTLAFSANAYSCFDGMLFAHEVGHNMGGDHNPENANANDPPFSYARGHYVVGKARDVMAYSDPCGSDSNCPRTMQYSNPSVDFIGFPGTPSGIPDQRDNARSMRNMAPVIYDYRTLWNPSQRLGSGPLGGDPRPVSWGTGHNDVFWKGTDSALWHNYYSSSGWSGAQSLGAGPLGGEPNPASWGSGHIDVFWRGTDNNIWHKWFLSGWNGPENLGAGPIASDPVPVSWGSGNLDVFWRGTDNGLWHKYYNNGWSGFESLGTPCGSGGCGFAGQPSAVSWGTGHIAVFVRGLDGHLWMKSFQSGWQAWQDLGGGPLGGDPAAVSWGPGHLDVFWKGTNGAIWHRAFLFAGWGSVEQLLAEYDASSNPAPVSWGAGQIDVYWRTTTNALRYRRFNGSWRSPAQLATDVTGQPRATSWGLDHSEAFWRDGFANLGHVWQSR